MPDTYHRIYNNVFSNNTHEKVDFLGTISSVNTAKKQMQISLRGIDGKTRSLTATLEGKKLVFSPSKSKTAAYFVRGRVAKREPIRPDIDFQDMRVVALIQQFEGVWVGKLSSRRGGELVWPPVPESPLPRIMRVEEDCVVPLNGGDKWYQMERVDVDKQQIVLARHTNAHEILRCIIALSGEEMIMVSRSRSELPETMEPARANHYFVYGRKK